MAEPSDHTFLRDLLVVELGQRFGAGLCGSLFAELGATVIVVETDTPDAGSAKRPYRQSLAAGKRSLAVDPGAGNDVDLLVALIARSDVIIASPDDDPDWPAPVRAAIKGSHAIVADIKAFGDRGPLAGFGYPDALIQALAGSADTSGEPDGAPVLCRAPIIEVASALYVSAGVLAALRVRRLQGASQHVQAPLFDCAVGMLATFLPKHFSGGAVNRIGNHHPGMSPWNTYRTVDGWVLLCAGTDDQWRRVCALIGCPELTDDPRFKTNSDRVKNNAEVDPIIEAWTARLTIDQCVRELNSASISTGPILTIKDLNGEPNLSHRGMVRSLDGAAGRIAVPGTVFRGSIARGRIAGHVPAIDEDRAFVRQLADRPQSGAGPAQSRELQAPLSGVRVLEMGQFTTAPLVGRQLGALGADVVKLEPSNGEPSRHMPPHRNGQGYFFSLSNSEKRVMCLDLREPGRDRLLEELIAKADILVENTKPGTLPRHGFTPERILQINPRIVYCDISGFGSDTPSAGLGAMDTTIQGLSGVMDMTRSNGIPYKTGISIADLHAGQFALVAVLAALECRDRTGRGQYLDLAMLDAAAWATRSEWNLIDNARSYSVIKCADGYVVVGGDAGAESDLTRQALVDEFRAKGREAAPVLSVAETLAHAQATQSRVVTDGQSPSGEIWPLVACPIQLSLTPAQVSRAPGKLNGDADSVLRDWAVTWRPGVSTAA